MTGTAGRTAWFDVDCLEGDAAGTGLCLRPRVEPLADRVRALHDAAADRGDPLVFTICCSGRMAGPGDLPDVLHVPRDPADREWRARVPAFRRFLLQKRTLGDPDRNRACRTWDALGDNPNAALLVADLDARDWVVFGNGLELCVDATARGLLRLGQRVTVVRDVLADSHGATVEARRATLAALAEAGVRLADLREVLAGAG